MQPDYQLILSSTVLQSTSEKLKEVNHQIGAVEDWSALTKLLLKNTCAQLVYKKVQNLPNVNTIPEASLGMLRKAYYTTVSRSSLMYAEFAMVVEVFQQNDINFIALKGIYLCEWLYKDIGLRQFSDIDLLVKATDTTKAMELLKDIGYYQHDAVQGLSEFVDEISNKEGLDFTHYEAFTKNGISIEIHLKLSPDKHKDKYDIDIDAVFEKSVVATVNAQQIRVLHPHDLLLHIAIHTDLHFIHGHIQFTCFSDLVNLLERFKEGFNWDEFIARCKQFKCEQAVFTYLLLVNKYYNAYLPPAIIEKYQYIKLEKTDEEFLSYLKGETYKIESKTAVGGHLQTLKSIRSVSVLLRYLKEVVFPGKEFMVEKYLNQLIINNEQLIIKDKNELNQLIINNEKHLNQLIINNEQLTIEKKEMKLHRKLLIINSKLLIKYWWLWYPYRWFSGLKGLYYVITKKTQVKK